MASPSCSITFLPTGIGLSFGFQLVFLKWRVVSTISLQSELTKQQNMFKIELKLLEDELLTRLSAAESNFLGDNMLVEKLETTKHTAAEIEMKVNGSMLSCDKVV